MNLSARHAAAGAALLALVAAEVAALRVGAPTGGNVERLLTWYAVAGLIFVLGAWIVRGLPTRHAIAFTLGGGALLQAVAIGYSPTTTDDFWRYVWDGRVQADGINPYRYTPLDPALEHLRDPILFPPDPRSPEQVRRAADEGRTDICTTRGIPHDCTRINRPHVNTIYPPVAEAAFWGLHYLTPKDRPVEAVQIAAGLTALGVAGALMWALRRGGRDPRGAVWWAWCPVVWLECGNNAHIDVLAIAFLVGCLGLLARRGPPQAIREISRGRLIAAGALFGAGVAVKFVPILIAPALLIRRGHLLIGAAAGVVALSYLPHLLVVGTDVLGYLPGYLDEEGYSGEQRFGVPRLLIPDGIAPTVALIAGAWLATAIWRRCDSHPDLGDAVLLAGVAFILVGPSQPWYGLLLVALGTLAGRVEWFAVAAAAYPVYLAGYLEWSNTDMQRLAYLSAGAFVLAVALARRYAPRDLTSVRPAG